AGADRAGQLDGVVELSDRPLLRRQLTPKHHDISVRLGQFRRRGADTRRNSIGSLVKIERRSIIAIERVPRRSKDELESAPAQYLRRGRVELAREAIRLLCVVRDDLSDLDAAVAEALLQP